MRRIFAWRRPAVLLALAAGLAASLSGCKSLQRMVFGGPHAGTPGYVIGFLGAAVADDPRAALEARVILSSGGNAADAATTLALTLAVSLPSRAGLGGGGGCLAYFPPAKAPEAILFLPRPQASDEPAGGASSDRPAAVPMLARGLLTLQARYGSVPLARLIEPAEGLARYGVPVSSALARDLKVVAPALLLDRGSALFSAATGGPLAEGTTLMQPDLGATLAQIRLNGVNDLYAGALARRLIAAAAAAGSPIAAADLAAARAEVATPIMLAAGTERVAFLPLPADGGLAAAAAFQALQKNPNDLKAAQSLAIAIAARYRAAGGDASALLATPAATGSLPPLPASTSFLTLDRKGGAVACALTMGNLFGVGRIARGTGIVLAASPRAWPPPLLSAAIAWNPRRHAFRAEIGGSGQDGAPLAVAAALNEVLTMNPAAKPPPPFMPKPVPDPGRANVIACLNEMPGKDKTCHWQADPRLSGFATGGEDDWREQEK